MQHSEQLTEIAAAVSKAQGELKAAPFDSTNPAFRSKYASLASFQETYRPVLSRHGLSLIQSVDSDENGNYVSSLLLHISGQWISCRMKLILQKNDMQGFGSSCTYAKRYQASALLGISADEDDDGNAASHRPPPPKNFAPPPRPTPPPPKPDADPLDQALGNVPLSDYVFQATPLKGKKIGEVSQKSLNNFVDWYNGEQAKGQGFKTTPEVIEAYQKVVEYLSAGAK